MLGKTFNYIKGVDARPVSCIGRRELPLGKHTNVCPAIDGAISWNTGSYQPEALACSTRSARSGAIDIEVVKADRPEDFSGQAYFGA